MRNACAATAKRRKGRNRNDRGTGKGGSVRCGEIHMELEEIQIVSAEKQHEVRLPRRRRGSTVKICRQQAADAAALLEANLGRSRAGEHPAAIIGAGIGAHEDVAVKHVKSLVI